MTQFLFKGSRKLVVGVCFLIMLGMTVTAAPNFLDELAERVADSPFQAVEILFESLESGVSSIEVDTVNWRGDNERFFARLYSNDRAQEYALMVDFTDAWDEFDFAAFLNPNRLAVGSSLLGDDVLGIRFATFSEDLRVFLNSLSNLGIINEVPPAWEIDMIFRNAEIIMEALNSGAAQDINPLEMLDLLLPFMLSIQQTTEQVTVNSVNAERVAVTIDLDVIYHLLYNMVVRIGDDNIFFEIIREELRRGQNELDYGYVTVATYTSDTGRLLQVYVGLSVTSTTVNWRGEPRTDLLGLYLLANFGNSAMDTWTLEFTFVDNSWIDSGIVSWIILEPANNVIEHRFTFKESPLGFWDWQNMFWDYVFFNHEDLYFDFWDYGYHEDYLYSMWLEWDPGGFWDWHNEFWDYLFFNHASLYFDFWEYGYHEDYLHSMWLEWDADRSTQYDLVLGITWNRSNGELVLFYEEHTSWAGLQSGSITGQLIMTNNSFNMQFSESDFRIVAFAQVGVPVPTTTYINLDQWAYVSVVQEFMRAEFTNLVQPIMVTTPLEDLFIVPMDMVLTADRFAVPPATGMATVFNCHYLYLRTGAGVNYVAFNHLVAGDIVTILARRGNWVNVYTHRGTGWVFADYLYFH